jgi:ABC-type histidine transport system ATPase subunit
MFEPKFIQHRGARILRLDFTGLTLNELVAAFELAHRTMLGEPVGSLRILTILRSQLTRDTADVLKRYGLANRKVSIRASAVVGSCFWKVIVTHLQMHGREDLVLFDEEQSALDWLASK